VQGLIDKKREGHLSIDSLELENVAMNDDEVYANLAVVFDILFASLYEQRFQMFEGIDGE